jgi:GNAT superfamily N-acetyltransferase
VGIRPSNACDDPAIISLVNKAFAIETFLDGTRTDEERLAKMLEKGKCLVAEDEAGGIVASVYVELRGTRGYFGMLAVDPAKQGMGFGRTMVEAAEDYCREHGCSLMDISVLSLRPELPPFYSKLGYVESGVEEFHPSIPLRPGLECHSIVMSKKL